MNNIIAKIEAQIQYLIDDLSTQMLESANYVVMSTCRNYSVGERDGKAVVEFDKIAPTQWTLGAAKQLTSIVAKKGPHIIRWEVLPARQMKEIKLEELKNQLADLKRS